MGQLAPKYEPITPQLSKYQGRDASGGTGGGLVGEQQLCRWKGPSIAWQALGRPWRSWRVLLGPHQLGSRTPAVERDLTIGPSFGPPSRRKTGDRWWAWVSCQNHDQRNRWGKKRNWMSGAVRQIEKKTPQKQQTTSMKREVCGGRSHTQVTGPKLDLSLSPTGPPPVPPSEV